MQKPFVVFLGANCFDEYYLTEGELAPGNKLMAEFRSKEVGGMIANAASVFAGYGGCACMMDFLDASPESDELMRAMQGYGIHPAAISREPHYQNGKCMILLSKDGERTILVVEPKQKTYVLNQEQKQLLTECAFLYTTISDLKKLQDYQQALSAAFAGGARLALDVESTSFSGSADLALIQEAELVFVNQSALKKMQAACGTQVLEALRQKVPILVLTKGAQGSQIFRGAESYAIPAFPAQVVDTTGAGDTFNASFLFAHMMAWGLLECGRFASAAASEKIARFGARAGVRPLADILKRLEAENAKG
ncbi:MAG: carbohydrate kinase family protein [Anaerolineaceae bacterium]|nr:carbohydrate kinase family protein [Anaerolineaceae bacterium]